MENYATSKQLKEKAFRAKGNNMKQTIGIQVAFISENKPQKEQFLDKYGCFLATYASILNPCYDGNVHTHDRNKEVNKKAFTINSQKINQEIVIQVTFIFKINL